MVLCYNLLVDISKRRNQTPTTIFFELKSTHACLQNRFEERQIVVQ